MYQVFLDSLGSLLQYFSNFPPRNHSKLRLQKTLKIFGGEGFTEINYPDEFFISLSFPVTGHEMLHPHLLKKLLSLLRKFLDLNQRSVNEAQSGLLSFVNKVLL